MSWYIKCLKQYFDFKGRARRKEYWFFILFNAIFTVVAMVLDNVLGLASKEVRYGPLYGVYFWAMIIPSIAVTTRRLHDIGKSGWMQLVPLVLLIITLPLIIILSFKLASLFFILIFICEIWLLVLLVRDGDLNTNRYGANPKTLIS